MRLVKREGRLREGCAHANNIVLHKLVSPAKLAEKIYLTPGLFFQSRCPLDTHWIVHIFNSAKNNLLFLEANQNVNTIHPAIPSQHMSGSFRTFSHRTKYGLVKY